MNESMQNRRIEIIIQFIPKSLLLCNGVNSNYPQTIKNGNFKI